MLAILCILLNLFSKFQVIWFILYWVMNFVVQFKMLDRRRKSNFLISLASGLASDDSCSPTQKRRQCGHPIANVHANVTPIADRQPKRQQCGHPIADIDRQRPIL